MAAENIFSQYLQPVRSVQDYTNDYDKQALLKTQLEGATRQNALASLVYGQQVQDSQDKAADAAAIRSAYAGSGGDQNKLLQLLRGPTATRGTVDHASAVEAALLKRQETDAAIAEKKATTGKITADTAGLHLGVLKTLAGGVMASPTPQAAASALDAWERMTGQQSPGDRQALAAAGNDPEAIKRWAAGHALAADQLLPKIQTNNLGGSTVTQAIDPLTGKPTVTGAQRNTQSPDNAATVGATIRGQNLTDARARETNTLTREANATVYDAERGVLVNKGTGLARPAATFDGKPLGPKDKPLPEGAQKQIMGTRNLQDAVANYRERLAGWGNADMLSPDERAKMGNAYNNMMLQAKEAYNLGVLNGPDYDILQSVVKDPTKLTSALTSRGALDTQASELARIAAGIEKTAMEAHGKDYKPRDVQAQRPAASGAAKISGDAEYNALPSGATFIGPDGKTRRKP